MENSLFAINMQDYFGSGLCKIKFIFRIFLSVASKIEKVQVGSFLLSFVGRAGETI